MNIYLSNETNFNNNGLGFLKDCLSAKVTEVLNGDLYLDLEYPANTDMDQYLIEGNIIKCNIGNTNYQLFRITTVEKDLTRVTIHAIHIFYDLLDNMILDTYPKNKNATSFGTWLLEKTNFSHNFTFYSDIVGQKSARYVRRNPVEAFMGDISNSMINLFGGEIERDNFNIKLLAKRGRDAGVKLIFGKNIKSIKETIDITSLYTRVLPLGYDGLMLPEVYVDSPLINNYITPKITKIEFSDIKYDATGETEDAYTNIEDAYQALRDSVNTLYDNGLDKPSINIKVDWVELSKTNEYKNYSSLETVRIGDTITANILGIDYKTRVIKTTYNVLTDTTERFEIGTMTQSIVNSINSTTQKVESINVASILDSAKTNATNLLTSAMGGYVYKTRNELFIMDTDDPNTAQKVWRWNINGLGYSSTGINGTYGLAMTMDGQIVADMITTGKINTSLIEGYDSLTTTVQGYDGTISEINQTVNEINTKLSNISNVTVEKESTTGFADINGVNASLPIEIKIYPISESISYLYPYNGLYPSNSLYSKNRVVQFYNKTTSEYFYWELPTNLWLSSDKCDELVLSYGDGTAPTVTVTRKCGINADGSIYNLSEETTESYDYPLDLELSDGDYIVTLLGYNNVYMDVVLMASNLYTTQFATKTELNSSIRQTLTSVELDVSQKLTNYSTTTEMNSAIQLSANSITSTVAENYATKTTTNSLQTQINQKANSIELTASDESTSCGITIKLKNANGDEIDSASANVTLSGLVKFTDLSSAGSTTINGSNITTGTINADLITTGTINADLITSGTLNVTNINVSGTFKSANIPTLSANKISGGTLNITTKSGGYLRAGATTNHPEVSGLTVGSAGLVVNSTSTFNEVNMNLNNNGKYINFFNCAKTGTQGTLFRMYLGSSTSASSYTALSGFHTVTISGHTFSFMNGILTNLT